MTVTQLCFSYRGRINRAQYWGFGVITGILILLLYAMSNHFSYYSSLFGLMMTLLCVVPIPLIFYMGIPVSVKRLHDVGATGWTMLLMFVPILGTIILFVLTGFVKGDAETNKYGPPPEPLNGAIEQLPPHL